MGDRFHPTAHLEVLPDFLDSRLGEIELGQNEFPVTNPVSQFRVFRPLDNISL